MERWLTFWELFLLNDGLAIGYSMALIVILTIWELIIPAEKGHGLKGRLKNLLYFALFKVMGFGGLALWFTFVPMHFLPAGEFGLPMRAIMVVLNLVLIDFIYYWYHRSQHKVSWLWAIHELHHSDAELNATSSYRTYWLEMPVQGMIILMPTLFLFGGLGVAHANAVMFCSLFFLVFSHSNLRLQLGWFQKWMISPQIHRVHHSDLPQHRDRNFSQYFPVFDLIFGTFYNPKYDEFPSTGTHGLASDAPVWKVMVQPFRIWLFQLKNLSGK